MATVETQGIPICGDAHPFLVRPGTNGHFVQPQPDGNPDKEKVMAIPHIESSKILEAPLGARGGYINDAFLRKDAPPYKRIEITEGMAEAILNLVGWNASAGRRMSMNDRPAMSNKDFVCVRTAEQTGSALFVYAHDFTWWLFEVGY